MRLESFLIMVRILTIIMLIKLIATLRVMPNHRRNVEKIENTGNETQIDPENEKGKDEQTVVVEHELFDALTKHSSSLLDRTYVEKKGRNDFLVIRPDIYDPSVTVIPNAIYYNIEKKCVNWLDDCSLQGIRSRLLNRVGYP